MAQQRLAPDAIVTITGLSGSVSDIQNDPDGTPDTWLTSTGSNGELVVSFPTPTNPPTTGTGLQEIRLRLRKDATGGGTPTFTAEVHDAAGLHQTLATDVSIDTTGDGTVFGYTWDASGLDNSDGSTVEVRLVFSKGGGGPNERNVEVEAIEWNVEAANAISGTADQTLSALSQSATGSVVTPIDVNGTIDQSLAGNPSRNVYYFDASVSGPTDADLKWLNDSTAFNGSTVDAASSNTDPKYSYPFTANLLTAVGYSGPTSGDPISKVRVRIQGYSTSLNHRGGAIILDGSTILGTCFTPVGSSGGIRPGEWAELDAPAGGWTYAKLDAIECRLYASISTCVFGVIEIEVTTGAPALSQTATGAVYNPHRTGTIDQAASGVANGALALSTPLRILDSGGIAPGFDSVFALQANNDSYLEPLSDTTDTWFEVDIKLQPRSIYSRLHSTDTTTWVRWYASRTNLDSTAPPQIRALVYDSLGTLLHTSAWMDVDPPDLDSNDTELSSSFNVSAADGDGQGGVGSWRVRWETKHASDAGGDSAVRVSYVSLYVDYEERFGIAELASGSVQTPAGAVTGTAEQTLSPIDQAATGDVVHALTGTADQSLAAIDQAASGSVWRAISGTIAQLLATVDQTATGDVTGVREGVADQTLGAVDQSATGTVTAGANNITGTAEQTLGVVTQTATGTVYRQISGAIDQLLPGVTQSATGDVTGVREGAIDQTLLGVNQSATGVVWRAISGVAAQDLAGINQTATGDVTGIREGSISQTLAAVDQAATGTVSDNSRTGDIWQDLTGVDQAATGSVYREISGIAAQTLTGVDQASTGDVTQTIEGTADQTLAAVNQSGTGTVSDNSREGVIDQTLAAVTQSAAGKSYIQISGAAEQDLAAVDQSATGTVSDNSREGTIAQDLAPATQTATGVVYRQIAGAAAQTLPAITQVATGSVSDNSRTGTIAQTLAAVNQSATGISYAKISGVADQTLAALEQTATGTVSDNSRDGVIDQTFAAVTQSATGSVYDPAREGEIAQTLPSVAQTAAGSVYRQISGVAIQSLESVSQAATGDVTGIREGSALSVLQAPTQDAIGAVYRAIFGVATQTLASIDQEAIGQLELVRPFSFVGGVIIKPDGTSAGPISTSVSKSVTIKTEKGG